MSKTLKASLVLGLAGTIYGLFLTILKIANNNGYMREDLMVGQYLFALVVFAIAVLIKRPERLKGKQRIKLMLIGAFGFGTNFCLYGAVAATNTSFAVTMLFQYVWLGILFDSLITRKLPTKPIAAAVVLVVLGTPLAAGVFDSENVINLPGLLWGSGAAIFYVGMLWTSARLETQVTSVVRTFYFSLTQTLLATLAAPQFFVTSFFDPGAWLFAIPLGLTTAVIPTFLIMRNAPKVPVGITTIMTGMELPSTIVLGIIVLGEAHSAISITGVLLICAGIITANWDGIAEARSKPLQAEK